MANYTVTNTFIDKYNKKKYKIGEVLDLTDERAAEIKKVDNTLIEIVPEEPAEDAAESAEEPAEETPSKQARGRKGTK